MKGFSFSLGFTLFLLLLSVIPFERINLNIFDFFGSSDLLESPDLVVTNTSLREIKDNYYQMELMGSVINQGTNTWDDIFVLVDYFDAEGKFFEQTVMISVEGMLHPEDALYFKEKIKFDETNTVDRIHDYRVIITQANTKD